jgi:hypothetical protein
MRSSSTGTVPSSHRPSLSITLAAVGCVLAVAGCGSSGSPSSAAGTGSGDALALQFADCMRSHGVPNFPDPGSPVGGPGSGINERAPAFVSAEQTCNKLQPGGRPKGSPLPEAQRVAALAQAQCIREHGVPNWPDPTFPSTGGMFIAAPPGVNLQSPAFKQASAACGLRPRPG